MDLKLIRQILLNMSRRMLQVFLVNCMLLNTLYASNLNAQQVKSVKDVLIKIKLENANLHQVLTGIESKTVYEFSYDGEDLDNEFRFTAKFNNASVADVLLEISKQTNLKFRQVNNNIHISKKAIDSMDEKPLEIIIDGVTITGKVTGDDGELPGVNVILKGTLQGTVTDLNGDYSIEVPGSEAVLVFSSVGFLSEEVLVGNRTVIDLTMTPDITALEEIIVVGYGTQKKSDIVGAVASVSSEKLDDNANPNLFQAIQASVPGLNISRGSGEPGSSGSIQIRGLNSISASNDPLIVVDGIPFSGNIRDINPNDISSVEILKDASASAIYGSRAASGVILISTKKGTAGKTVVELNASWSFQNEAVEYQLMDADQFYEFRKQAHIKEGNITGNELEDEIAERILENNELKSWELGESVNWMDEMLNRGALRQEYQISVRSGSENYRNYFSLSYVDEGGLQKGTGFNRVTVKNNLELLSIASWLKIGNNTLFTNNNYERVVWGINNQPAFYRLSPFSRIYEDDGSYTRFPQANDELLVNPIAETELSSQQNSFNNLFNNIYLDLSPEFVKGFSYRMNFGTTLRFTKEALYWPRGTWLGDANNGLAEVSDSKLFDYTWENILKYQTTFGDHSIDFTGLYSRQSSDFERVTTGAAGFVTDDLLWYNPNAGETPILPSNGFNPKNEWDLVSYMARMNYNYNGKYYLTATVRRDGYSGFAVNNKYGTFPSAALAWRISAEPFMSGSESWLDDLKIRTSYGTVGNQAVGTYRSLAQLRNSPYVFGESVFGGVKVNSLRNDDLGWEKATTLNVGADFSMYEGKLSGSLDFYNTQTGDLLLNREIPKMTGQQSILYNIGSLKNVGYEVAINSIPVSTDNFTWRLGVNFSANQNEIVDLYGNKEDDIQNNWFIGEPLNVIYDYEFDGIWQLGDDDEIANSATPDREPGDVRIVDQNNDGKIDADDRKIVGVGQPDWLGGLSSTFTYKGLSLNIFIQTVQGIDKRYIEEGVSARFNKAPYDYWTPENPSNTWFVPRINNMPTPYGSIAVYDASYTRIKDITLAYVLPESFSGKLGLDKVRVYANLHDFFTFTKFPFVDPESAAYAQISIPKYVLFGLNVAF